MKFGKQGENWRKARNTTDQNNTVVIFLIQYHKKEIPLYEELDYKKHITSTMYILV